MPAATIMTETAGLKLPPEDLPKRRMDVARAAPIGMADPVAIMTYKNSKVPNGGMHVKISNKSN